ncbi:MAG: hypothetical protein WB239_08010 [Acidimicrobiia bacterium]
MMNELNSKRSVKWRVLRIFLIALVVFPLALPAYAVSEDGTKACLANSHVYTKGRWRYEYHSYLDIVPPNGVKDKQVTRSSASDDYFSTYLNTYSTGSVNTNIKNAYYYIWGQNLSLAQSWPGCEAD